MKATEWTQIEAQSGLGREAITRAAQIFASSERDQLLGHGDHPAQAFGRHHSRNRQPAPDVRPDWQAGAGLCPVRGHSNVQGNRTMGINEKPNAAFLDRLERRFPVGFKRTPGTTSTRPSKPFMAARARCSSALGQPGSRRAGYRVHL